MNIGFEYIVRAAATTTEKRQSLTEASARTGGQTRRHRGEGVPWRVFKLPAAIRERENIAGGNL